MSSVYLQTVKSGTSAIMCSASGRPPAPVWHHTHTHIHAHTCASSARRPVYVLFNQRLPNFTSGSWKMQKHVRTRGKINQGCLSRCEKQRKSPKSAGNILGIDVLVSAGREREQTNPRVWNSESSKKISLRLSFSWIMGCLWTMFIQL